jgi:hypothetical protein
MDPHGDCEVGGLAGVTAKMLTQREALVFGWCRQQGIPAAFVLAGGYTGPQLSRERLVGLHHLTIRAAARVPAPGGSPLPGVRQKSNPGRTN